MTDNRPSEERGSFNRGIALGAFYGAVLIAFATFGTHNRTVLGAMALILLAIAAFNLIYAQRVSRR